MATTSPDNLRTPDPGDPYNLVPDLATLAGDVQAALLLRDNNTGSGTASQRTAFTSTAPDGFLWQDTDGIKMIWRKDGAVWVPAVWRWSGTNTQMTGFAPPDGFEWFNTTDRRTYSRIGSAWGVPGGALQRTTTTYLQTSSSSFVATDLYHSITPISTASRIQITASFVLGTSAANGNALATLFRGGTSGVNLGSANGLGQVYSSAGALRSSLSLSFLDSPGTTSSVTYTLAIRSVSGAVDFLPSNTTAAMVLKEIV